MKRSISLMKKLVCGGFLEETGLMNDMPHLLPKAEVIIIKVISQRMSTPVLAIEKKENHYGISSAPKFRFKQVYGYFTSGLLPPYSIIDPFTTKSFFEFFKQHK
ncbi:MAG: hypothetical protein RBS07_12575 [Lentimicrobium sp.]|jgi:hypothetical protein|nr:hypothetical protein [Lentimicrobium sp.]